MDAAASHIKDAEFDKIYDFFLKIENNRFPASIQQRHSVIKYTKLPDVDFDSRMTWQEETYSLQPRLRRIVSINEPKLASTRSLKPNIANAPGLMMRNITKRKIVTIEEDDESDLHPKFSTVGRKSISKTSSRAVGTEVKEEKILSQRTTSRLSPSSKYSKESKSAKNILPNNKKENDASKLSNRNKYSVAEKSSVPNYLRNQKNKEREGVTRSPKNVFTKSKISISKSFDTPSENEKDISLTKNKLSDNWSNNILPKKISEKQKRIKSPLRQQKSKTTFMKDIKETNKPVTIIHVPLDEKYKKREKASEISESMLNATLNKVKQVDRSTEVERIVISKDVNVGTEPLPTTVDQVTEIDTEYEAICKCIEETKIHTEELKETFDSLDIPNVSLIKDRTFNFPKENVVNFCSKSLPNVMFDTLAHNKINGSIDPRFSKSASYVISRATLTYTTKQKINFHVVGNNEEVSKDISASPLSYPMSVVSLFKKKIKNKDLYRNSEIKIKRNDEKTHKQYNNSGDTNPPLCPFTFDRDKLVKPSDIISTISVHNGLLQTDYICEQFQRELNFIDSFFESLQYLEHCSLAEKCLSENKVESWINKSGYDLKQLEYGSLLSKFDNETLVDDSETMASKSLCLLNLLIRDEQRRAKNLLFVLKMREDALKDFTKSQIIWLENKKKQDNIDISTLKKKQRGALLKLQYECGEMQRMRKALLTLSEKRKVALIKTKKNIELKLKNNIDVDKILLGKKKIKKNNVTDRGLTPVKCFDLSSSGCDDSTISRSRSETPVITPEVLAPIDIMTSAEKSIQTSDSIVASQMIEQSTNTADENFVVVDGGYLNILFHNLSLPQIFSSGKQYEVNEEALKNIVNTANNNHCNVNEGGDIERFMDQIKNHEADRSSSPSTARSLVEEFDQYYRGLVEEEKSIESPQRRGDHGHVICEVKDTVIQVAESKVVDVERSWDRQEDRYPEESNGSDVGSLGRECHACESGIEGMGGMETSKEMGASVAGPLPVPAGAAASPDTTPPDVLTWPTHKSSSTSTSSEINSSSSATISSIPSVPSPVHYEAEELRRQQLAIEREIKALEQQQCQLLVVREIPDKPPPPYTPPNKSRAPKPPRMFLLDDATEHKICKYISESTNTAFDSSEPFEVFVKDFCQETLKNQTPERSDKPWHSCNLLPQKPPDTVEKIVEKTTSHLAEVLKGVTPTVVSGVGARRSDHIDDILFAEWRRCEPEWTALHADEAVVKNQLFESIFQRILTETVDEYKRTVLNVKDDVPP